jgi:MFS superfamily sulfate permease-like transporter
MDWLNIWLPEPIPLVCLPNILWIAQIYAGVYFHIILSCCIFIRNLSFRTSHFVFPKKCDLSHMVLYN